MVKDIGQLGSLNGGNLVWKISNGKVMGPSGVGVDASLEPCPGTNYAWVNFAFDKDLWVAPKVGKTIMVLFERDGLDPMHIRLVLLAESKSKIFMHCKINLGTISYKIKALPGIVSMRSDAKRLRRKNRKRDDSFWSSRWGRW